MNLKNALLVLIFSLVATYVEALEIAPVDNPMENVEMGEIQIAGNACIQAIISAPEDLSSLILPLSVSLKKVPEATLKRGTCMFSMPVKVKSGYRLVLSDLSAEGVVNLRKGSKSRIDLEVFKSGEKGQIQTAQHDANLKKVREDVDLIQAGEILVLDCGQSGILRANASILLQGSSRATASLFTIRAKATVQPCN